MAGAGEEEDNTLIWALDRLLDSRQVSAGVLTEQVLPAVASRPEELPDATRAKLCLRLLDANLAEGRVDNNVLLYLQQLAACDVSLVADPALVCPSPALILRVKTELGIQTWREQGLSAGEAAGVLSQLFAGECTAEEYGRYDRLMAALCSPALAQALVAEFNFQRLLVSLINFVTKALLALPSFLMRVQADVLAGRYVIGAGAPQQPAASVHVASPGSRRIAAMLPSFARQQSGSAWRPQMRAAAPAVTALRSPMPMPMPGADEEADMLPPVGGEEEDCGSPEQQQRQQEPASPSHGRQSVLRHLDAGLASLAQRGGRDPLPEMLHHAADAAQQAGGVAAAARGRSVRWGSDSPAVQHPMPEMQPARFQQHEPLAQRSPVRQLGERAATGEASAMRQRREREQTEGGKLRRKRLLWSNDEIAELIALVKQHGRGSWATIVDKGHGVFDSTRNSVDMKDKWRNLVKAEVIPAHVIQEIEAKEAALREELWQGKRVGRPPKFVLPKLTKKQRLTSGEGDDEDEGQDSGDPIGDADDEEGEEEGVDGNESTEEEQQQQEEEEEEQAEQEKKPPPRRSGRRHQ